MSEYHEGCEECQVLEFLVNGHDILVATECGSDTVSLTCDTCEFSDEYPEPETSEGWAQFQELLNGAVWLHAMDTLYIVTEDDDEPFKPPSKLSRILAILKEEKQSWHQLDSPSEGSTIV